MLKIHLKWDGWSKIRSHLLTHAMQLSWKLSLAWGKRTKTAIFVWPWKMVSVSVRFLFYRPVDEKIKTWTLRFPAKETLRWRRHCSIGQSCSSMTSKRRIDWFLESSLGHEVFSPERSLNQPKPRRVCIRSINQSNRSISVRFCFCFVRAFSF